MSIDNGSLILENRESVRDKDQLEDRPHDQQAARRIANRGARRAVVGLLVAFAAFMVAGRTLAGVHWLTDIVGGILLSFALVMLYRLAAAGVRRA